MFVGFQELEDIVTLLVSKGMGQADTLAARCCVKGCLEQQIFVWLAPCGFCVGKRQKRFRLV
jgi:hypothetical protein